jgi:hypothetical protein
VGNVQGGMSTHLFHQICVQHSGVYSH